MTYRGEVKTTADRMKRKSTVKFAARFLRQPNPQSLSPPRLRHRLRSPKHQAPAAAIFDATGARMSGDLSHGRESNYSPRHSAQSLLWCLGFSLVAEFRLPTANAPPPTYTFKLIGSWLEVWGSGKQRSDSFTRKTVISSRHEVAVPSVAQPDSGTALEAEAPLTPTPYVSGRPLGSEQSSPLLPVFWGRRGLRAGWRVLIFLVILATLFGIEMFVLRAMGRNPLSSKKLTSEGLGWWLTHTKALAFALVLTTSWIMAKVERRRIADYGLPWQQAFRRPFWLGAVIGFSALTSLLGAMRATGVFRFGVPSLHGAQICKYAALSAVVFLFGALFEEFLFRGYVQFALTTGLGFWPAAVVTSALFGGAHYTSFGETIVGTLSAGAVGFLFCLFLRRTGDLWTPVGFHAAWNWGETYFYGVPNSGGIASNHLFNGSFSGPQWLTGGSVGPEGSWFCLVLLLILFVVFGVCLRQIKYPGPAALS
jgi:uncharacterized protein